MQRRTAARPRLLVAACFSPCFLQAAGWLQKLAVLAVLQLAGGSGGYFSARSYARLQSNTDVLRTHDAELPHLKLVCRYTSTMRVLFGVSPCSPGQGLRPLVLAP